AARRDVDQLYGHPATIRWLRLAAGDPGTRAWRSARSELRRRRASPALDRRHAARLAVGSRGRRERRAAARARAAVRRMDAAPLETGSARLRPPARALAHAP